MSDGSKPPHDIERRLGESETLLWWDRPDPGAAMRREVNIGLGVGIFFFLFSLFWMWKASDGGGFFALFGLPFVGVGLWLVSAPLRAYRNAGATLFALTDRRALILKGASMRAFPLEHVAFVESESDAAGMGHVLFFQDLSSGVQLGDGSMPRKAGFIAVPEPEKVAATMLDLIERRRVRSSAAG